MIGKESKKLALRQATSQEARKANKRLDGRDAQISTVRDTATGAETTADAAQTTADNAQDAADLALGSQLGSVVNIVASGGSHTFVHGTGFIPFWVHVQGSWNGTSWYQLVDGVSAISIEITTSDVIVTNIGSVDVSVRVRVLFAF